MHGYFLPWKFTLYSTNIFLFNFSVSDLTFKFLGFSQCSNKRQKINNLDVTFAYFWLHAEYTLVWTTNIMRHVSWGWRHNALECSNANDKCGSRDLRLLYEIWDTEIWDYYMYCWSNGNSLCLKEYILKQQIQWWLHFLYILKYNDISHSF